ncbi:hypothetical protein QE152_g13965 [Popillia japonica]|uniref:Uncharacterized protein n=1 Tax=Popillia japonica TaxID=7064 RepID=A0AAW1LAL3_POPJA
MHLEVVYILLQKYITVQFDFKLNQEAYYKMFKAIVFAAFLAFALATPAPEPKAKPGYVAAAYTAPVVAAPYAYSAYAAPYAAYSTYPAYSAYSAYPYSAPLVYA